MDTLKNDSLTLQGSSLLDGHTTLQNEEKKRNVAWTKEEPSVGQN
jgi:hypothetical protein